MDLLSLADHDVEQVLASRGNGNPLNAEWDDLYGTLCLLIARKGRGIQAHKRVNHLMVAAAAIHYMRDLFESERSFWDGFTTDVGVPREPLFEVLYQWLSAAGIELIPGVRREVVKTLLRLTGIPVAWNRDFADFFMWFWRHCDGLAGQEAWASYHRSGELAGREISFCPAADRLRVVFLWLREQGVPAETDVDELRRLATETLGLEFDPWRIVRRTDSILKLWRSLFQRLTVGQFRTWLRDHPGTQLTLPSGKVKTAREVLVKDEIEFGSYVTRDGQDLEVVPHLRVGVEQIFREWPEDKPWLGLSGYVGFQSRVPFRVAREGELYEASRPLHHRGKSRHIAICSLPLGGSLEFPGCIVPGRTGIEWPAPDFRLEREGDDLKLLLTFPQVTVVLPDLPGAAVELSVEAENGTVIRRNFKLNAHGYLSHVDLRLPLEARVGLLRCQLQISGHGLLERKVGVPAAFLFAPAGDRVPVRRRSARFGQRRYTLLLANGEQEPVYDTAEIQLEWFPNDCGNYRAARVRWAKGCFRLEAGGLAWEIERGVSADLFMTRHAVDSGSGPIVLQWPSYVANKLSDFRVRLSTSGPFDPAGLDLCLYRNHEEIHRLPVVRNTLLVAEQPLVDLTIWDLAPGVTAELGLAAQVPGAYELVLAGSDTVLSRWRFLLVTKLRVDHALPLLPESNTAIGKVTAAVPALLQQDGSMHTEYCLSIPYRVHEVSDEATVVRCHPEPVRTSFTLLHPQTRVEVVATPPVCGVRAFVRRGRAWEKTPYLDYAELSSSALYCFGQPNAVMSLRGPDDEPIRSLRLDNEGHGWIQDLSVLASFCKGDQASIGVVFRDTCAIQLPIRRPHRYRAALLPEAVLPGERLELSVEVNVPNGVALAIRLVGGSQDLLLPYTVSWLRSGWQRLTVGVVVASLPLVGTWRVYLMLGDRSYHLGTVSNAALVAAGGTGLPEVPPEELLDTASPVISAWARGELPHFSLWCPVKEYRRKLVDHIQNVCPNTVVRWPSEADVGEPVDDHLLASPTNVALRSGIGIASGASLQVALAALAASTQAPVVVPEAHLLTAFERAVLSQCRRRICLVAAQPIHLE